MSFPLTRLQRIRRDLFSRRLARENLLSTDDLIMPVFVCELNQQAGPIAAMPGISRWSLEQITQEVGEINALKIPAIALFPCINPENKSIDAKEAYNPNGIMARAIGKLKQAFPNLGLIVDIALDPFTISGHDGILDSDEQIDNDLTNEILVKQALCYAAAGADVLAPSDMMDGRIGLIRAALEAQGYKYLKILAYSAKYASAYYGPFRDAVGTKKLNTSLCKSAYQIDPANSLEALHEIELDINEGADMVVIKPGMPYLDIIYRARQAFKVPILAYQVSGEYSMHLLTSSTEHLNLQSIVLESLICFKRAGATAIISYHAKAAASWLSQEIGLR